jgi:hypothetical protein
MWEMSSRRFHESNGNNKAEYISSLEKYEFGQTKMKLLSHVISGNRAIVKLYLRVWSHNDQKWIADQVEEIWVFEDDHWAFDSQTGSGNSVPEKQPEQSKSSMHSKNESTET